MATAQAMHAALKAWTRAGGPVNVDLSAVTFMDRTGIRALLKAAKALGDRGRIIIHGVHGPVKKVVDITGLAAKPNIHVIDAQCLTQLPESV